MAEAQARGGFSVTSADLADLLHYDLGAFGGEGDIPEPTTAELRRFREVVYAAQEKVTGLPADPPEGVDPQEHSDALLKALSGMTSEQRDTLTDANLEAVIEICKGSPSRDTIMALPALKQAAFVGWVAETFSPLF